MEGERRRGKAATALPSAAGSSWVCAHQQVGTEGEAASPRHIVPLAWLGRTVGCSPGLLSELVPGKNLGRAGSCLAVTCSPGKVCFSFAAKARVVWLQVCTSPPPAVGYVGLIRLHFCFKLFLFCLFCCCCYGFFFPFFFFKATSK